MTDRLLSAAFPHAPAEHLDRFIRNINATGHCWIWRGAAPGRYGHFHIDGVQHRGHRLAWSWATGFPLIDGAHVHHRCRVRACVNPDHLELVSVRTHARHHGSLVPVSFFKQRERFAQDQPVETVAPTCRRCGGPLHQRRVGCNACRVRHEHRQWAEDYLNTIAEAS